MLECPAPALNAATRLGTVSGMKYACVLLCTLSLIPASAAEQMSLPKDWRRRAETQVREGVQYACVDVEHPAPGVRQRVHLVCVRPGKGWKLDLSALPEKPGSMEKLGEQAKSARAIVAINGTFYDTTTFVSTCTLRIDGKTLVPAKHPDEFREFGALALDPAGRLALVAKSAPAWSDAAAFPDLMAGGPVLLQEGRVYAQNRNPHDRMRHARTICGQAKDGTVWLAAVDGYMLDAAGMTYAEGGSLMAALGCVDALNLDGGRSTGLWIDSPKQEEWVQTPGFLRLDYPVPLPNAVLIVPEG